jgi:hypothetical protein
MALSCPRCGNSFLQRVRPDGPLDRLLERLFLYAFRCQICRHRFHAVRWGIRYDRDPEDRRQYVRHPVRFPATLRSQHGEHEGRATDLSISGCSIAVFAPYRAGDALSVRLHAPGEGPPIEVNTAIVRAVFPGRLGVEFLALGREDEARLRELMLTLWVEGTPSAWRTRWENARATRDGIETIGGHGENSPVTTRVEQ